MNPSEHTLLMHAVLDGEATPGETAELERLLAASPAAQAEFDDLQRLFEGLKGVPMAFPPEGLVHSVMASLPPDIPRRQARSGVIRQLFSGSRVIGVIGEQSMQAPGAIPGKSATVHPISQRGPYFRGEKNMSEQNNSSFGNRKIWIGAGVAAAAVIVAVSTGVLPPGGKDTAGTIVPAQRYMAPQGTAADVKLGNPSSAQSTQGIPAAQDAAGSAASKVNSAATQANSAATQVNSAATQANSAATQVNSAATQANSAATQVNSAADQAQSAAAQVNSAAGQAQSAAGQAQSAAAQVNSAASKANSAAAQVNSAASKANSAAAQVNSAASNANSAASQTNSAAAQANSAASKANSAAAQVNSAANNAAASSAANKAVNAAAASSSNAAANSSSKQ